MALSASVLLFACTKNSSEERSIKEMDASTLNAEGQGGRPLSAALAGINEVPNPADPDGSGMAKVTLNQGQGTISYELHVSGIVPAAAAHIHVGAAGTNGPVVVHLMAPTSGSSMGTVKVDEALIKAIRQNPEGYYVNVHNSEFPGGAVRGQLMK